MAAVRQKHTGPELTVRKMAHSLGYRFRLHRNDLPGAPDIVFPSRRAVIFVHGCFWHRHQGCKRATMPGNRREYWAEKFRRTQLRDVSHTQKLMAAGWTVHVIWECETTDRNQLRSRLQSILSS